MKTQITSPSKNVLILQVIQRAELQIFSEIFVKCLLIFDLEVTHQTGKEGSCDS